MNDKALNILFIEDLPTDMEIAERSLTKAGLNFASSRVETEAELIDALRSFKPDVVVSDYSMPLYNGMSALQLVLEFDPYLPFIILTGSMNEDTAVNCLKAGACDYVIKEHIARLPFAVTEAIQLKAGQKNLFLQGRQLQQSEVRYRSIFENSNAMMLIVDPENQSITDANKAAERYYGWPRSTLIGKSMAEINTLPLARLKEQMRMAISSEKGYFQFKHRHADGTVSDVEIHSGPIVIDDKTYLFSIIHDISLQIQAQRDRDDFSEKLSHYLATSPTITYAYRLLDGEIHMQWISENIATILGYSAQEAFAKAWWFNNLASEDRAEALQGIAELTRLGHYSHAYRFLKKDRSTVWLRDEMRFARANGRDNEEVVGTLTDISERKRS
ncbi:MAG TPA: hypothetical protein DCG47_09610, partial [Spirochaetaceae bacterium]|nr:hypothetical protein [Spirochaetaceae bacterium]